MKKDFFLAEKKARVDDSGLEEGHGQNGWSWVFHEKAVYNGLDRNHGRSSAICACVDKAWLPEAKENALVSHCFYNKVP